MMVVGALSNCCQSGEPANPFHETSRSFVHKLTPLMALIRTEKSSLQWSPTFMARQEEPCSTIMLDTTCDCDLAFQLATEPAVSDGRYVLVSSMRLLRDSGPLNVQRTAVMIKNGVLSSNPPRKR